MRAETLFHDSQHRLIIAKQDNALATFALFLAKPTGTQPNTIKAAIGHVMKESGGSADPNRIGKLAREIGIPE